MIDLVPVFNQLREIALAADKQRLSVWWTQVRLEYPEFAEHVEICAEMRDALEVIEYLIEQDQRFLLLRYTPQAAPTIEFILNYLRGEKTQHEQLTP